MTKEFDVIVVGGGHAGAEAAAAAANLGSKTLLVTMNLQTIGQMSCNPAMGGVAKGQIVREIDALGGLSGIITDKTMIQFRMLNRSKGPAMWSPRVQSDRFRFAEEWRLALEGIPNLSLFQDMVDEIIINDSKAQGVKTRMGYSFTSKSVVLTNGTFLNGLIHIGENQHGGGRAGEGASRGITEQLLSLGFESGRMKTGTPPRVDGRTIDFSKLEEQKGDESPGKFSFSNSTAPLSAQRSCWITYTNKETHDILRTGFDRSPMFNGAIQSSGPRYCPSIEDKIDRFADKDRHQIFLEPEGWDTVEMYVNGFSTSLPIDVQEKAIKTIPGFENVSFFRPGYAIEYDYFPPTQLTHTLETKKIENLFFAGQINGTTGYEEAAGQGLIAGINAHQKINSLEAFILGREEAYIGVLIDDLVTKGTEEPYRMFTSRAEYRLLLRQDNADSRLTPRGYAIGLASEERMQNLQLKESVIANQIKTLRGLSLNPDEINPLLAELGSAEVPQKTKAAKLLSRPQINIRELIKVPAVQSELSNESWTEEILDQIEIQVKYQGYFEKEKENVLKQQALSDLRIPENFDYHKLKSLSTEARIKLSEIRPKTISQARGISGVSPSDISVLIVFMGR